MKFPLVLDLAADGLPVTVACRALGFSKQAFYAWKAAPVTEREWSDAHLINAAMESFFSLLQKNILGRQRWTTRADLRLAVVTWIEKIYHRKRRQRNLGRLTPVEVETINTGLKAA